MKVISRKILALALAAPLFISSLIQTANGSESYDDDIVDVAVAAGSFKTLVAAVKAAGLVETLKGDGPFTVFAPSDEAFALLGESTINSLLEPENRDQLTQILTFHVVPGKITSDDLLSSSRAKTVNGKSLPIGLSIGNANIVATDIRASNGIIHVIDKVLIPRETSNSSKRSGKKSRQQRKALELVDLAIEQGVPLFNRGQEEACAAIYQITAEALLNLDADLESSSRRALRKGLRDARNNHNDGESAWILRRALDKVYADLQGGKMMTRQQSRSRH